MPIAPSTCCWPAMMFPLNQYFPRCAAAGGKLEGYVTRQLDALAQGLKGWAFKSREPATLGDGLTAGEWVRASYLRDGKRIWQNQAVFALAEGRVLVFTTAMARKLTPQDDALLLQVLSSYRAA